MPSAPPPLPQPHEDREPRRARLVSLAPDCCWLVDAGYIDVFGVVDGDAALATRLHLGRIGAGQCVFGVARGDATPEVTLEALAGADARIRPASMTPLHRGRAQGEPCVDAANAFERWVEALSVGITTDVPPKDAATLEPGRAVDVRARVHVRPAAGVVWVRAVSAEMAAFGDRSVRIAPDTLAPCSPRLWLQTLGAARLEVIDTAALVAEGNVEVALAGFHDLVCRAALAVARRRAEAQRDRMRRQSAERRHLFTVAFSKLSGTLDAVAARRGRVPAVTAADSDELLATCRAIGEAQHISVTAPPRHDAHARDPVAAIAKASGCRTRRVILKGAWWKRENGPLLAQHGEDKRPVALIPAAPCRYELYDPRDGRRTAVTSAVAAQIAPSAVMFYRVFDARPISFRDVLRFGMIGSKRDALIIVAMGLAGGALGVVPPYATGLLVGSIIPTANYPQLVQLTAILLLGAVVGSLFEAVRRLAVVRIDGRFGSAVQAAVWDRVLNLPMPFFRPYAAGDLAVRAMGMDAIRQLVSGAAVTAIFGGIFSVFNFALLFYYDTHLAWWALLLVAIAVLVTALVGYFQLRIQRMVSQLRAKTSGIVLQLLTGVAKLRVAGAEVQAFAVWADAFSRQRTLQFRVRRLSNWFAVFNAAFPMLALVVLFAIVTSSATPLRTGVLVAFLGAFTMCLTAALSTGMAVVGMMAAVPIYELAQPIFHALPESDEFKADPGVLSGSIEISHLTFSYDANATLTLHDLSLTIPAGSFVAFVGSSGCGKSTLLRLLLGMEAPTSGSIFYDGQDLAGLDVRAVRAQVGVAWQSGRLANGDLFHNIVGATSATIHDAWEAAAMAGVDADIKQMPMGMHTVVSESGTTLSGGQRQRVLIARAIIGKPRLLFFDEATSALDNRTQAIVTESLERLRATRIVVAHRLTTIMKADRIYVMDRGRIVESGTYDELMRAGGRMAELVRRQLV